MITQRTESLTVPQGRCLGHVADVREATSRAYHRFYGSPGESLRLHAVTGTNGKTSTSLLLGAILAQAGVATGIIGTLGAFQNGSQTESTGTMTTPPPQILYPMLQRMRQSGITDVILEVSSHAMAQKRVAPLRFETGIFTNLSHEHLDYHGSFEGYREAKSALFQQVNTAVYAQNAPYAPRVCEKAKNALCYGKNADIRAEILRRSDCGQELLISNKKETAKLFLPLVEGYMAENAMLAATAALSLGISLVTVCQALEAFRGIEGRMERVGDGEHDVSVYIDYAHTPEALERLLFEVRRFARGRIGLVFGCGGDRDSSKRAPMGRIAQQGADRVYITTDNPRSESPIRIVKNILEGMTASPHRVILDRKRAIRTAVLEAEPNDVLLIVGKGHETYTVDRSGVHPFNEKEIILSALAERKKGYTTRELNHENFR